MYGNVTSRIVVDATFKSKKSVVNEGKVTFPPSNRISKQLMSKIEARWEDYGLD